MVDYNYPCLNTNNWKSSVSDVGGTPGYYNSVKGKLENYPTSILEGLSKISERNCELVFSETLDSISASKVANYSFIDSDIAINSAQAIPPLFREVFLSFSEALSKENLYTLKINNGIIDCSGKHIFAEPLTFGVPQKADSADIIINEILFDANDFIPEFIELYNKSDKVIDLKDFDIASIDEFSDTIKSSKVITSQKLSVFPKVLCCFNPR